MTELPEAYWPNIFIDEGEADVDGFFSIVDDEEAGSSGFNPYICIYDDVAHPYESKCWRCGRLLEVCDELGLCHTCRVNLRST